MSQEIVRITVSIGAVLVDIIGSMASVNDEVCEKSSEIATLMMGCNIIAAHNLPEFTCDSLMKITNHHNRDTLKSELIW